MTDDIDIAFASLGRRAACNHERRILARLTNQETTVTEQMISTKCVADAFARASMAMEDAAAAFGGGTPVHVFAGALVAIMKWDADHEAVVITREAVANLPDDLSKAMLRHLPHKWPADTPDEPGGDTGGDVPAGGGDDGQAGDDPSGDDEPADGDDDDDDDGPSDVDVPGDATDLVTLHVDDLDRIADGGSYRLVGERTINRLPPGIMKPLMVDMSGARITYAGPETENGFFDLHPGCTDLVVTGTGTEEGVDISGPCSLVRVRKHAGQGAGRRVSLAGIRAGRLTSAVFIQGGAEFASLTLLDSLFPSLLRYGVWGRVAESARVVGNTFDFDPSATRAEHCLRMYGKRISIENNTLTNLIVQQPGGYHKACVWLPEADGFVVHGNDAHGGQIAFGGDRSAGGGRAENGSIDSNLVYSNPMTSVPIAMKGDCHNVAIEWNIVRATGGGPWLYVRAVDDDPARPDNDGPACTNVTWRGNTLAIGDAEQVAANAWEYVQTHDRMDEAIANGCGPVL